MIEKENPLRRILRITALRAARRGGFLGGEHRPPRRLSSGLPLEARRWMSTAMLSGMVFLGVAGAFTPARAAMGEGHAHGSAGPEQSGVPIDLSKGWCGEHGVPESVCTRCDGSLIAKFKKAGDWCGGHGLPESQCALCNPGIERKWAALRPGESVAPPNPINPPNEKNSPNAPEGSPIHAPHVHGDDCEGHGHNGESGALAADPRAPAWTMERSTPGIVGPNDPLCPVETLRVRFRDRGILLKSGITVEQAAPRPMSAALTLPAEVAFKATKMTRVTPRVPGAVQEVPVEVGASVRRGEVLAILDSSALGEAKSEYIERRQALRLAEADLARVGTIARGIGQMLETCVPGASADEVRAALQDWPIGEAKSKLLRAQATLELARSEAQREAALMEKNLSSARELDVARAALASAEADFWAVREEVAFQIQRDRSAAERAVEVARLSSEALERKLHILGLTKDEVSKVGNESDAALTRLVVRSPASGTIIERRVSVGESVGADEELFVVADLSTMWLVVDSTERELGLLQVGQPVLFTVDGLPGRSFEGRLTWISPQIDERTRTVHMRADLPNPDGILRARMFGQARIILRDNTEVLTVSTDAAQTDGCCQIVFVQESDTVFQPRKVTLGTKSNGYVEVLEGLNPGEFVASAGAFLMKTEILKGNIGAGCCEVDPGR